MKIKSFLQKNFRSVAATIVLITLCILIILLSYHKTSHISAATNLQFVKVNPAFRQYIEGFTTGFVSTHTPIAIRFQGDCVDSSELNAPVDASIFKFKPDVKGSAKWIDTKTLVFEPLSPLKPNQFYQVSVHLASILPLPDSLKTFTFSFHTVKQDALILFDKMSYYDDNFNILKLEGTITFLDKINPETLQKHLIVIHENRVLPVKLISDKNQTRYYFVIDSIYRKNKETLVKISLDGEKIGMFGKLEKTRRIPALSSFELLNIQCQVWPEFVITFNFSEPLDQTQSLEGKISFPAQNYFTFSYQIDHCQVHIFPEKFPSIDTLHIRVSQTITNSRGVKLQKTYLEKLNIRELLPKIELLADGTIMPSAAQAILPFRVMNLKAVDVKIFKIFEQNIHQFLQMNDLEGQYQLSRVGKVVVQKTITFGHEGQFLNTWHTYHLDLSQLFDAEPGVIYKIELSAKKEYSMLPCEQNTPEHYSLAFYTNDAEQPEEWNFFVFSDYGWDFYDYEYYEYDIESDHPATVTSNTICSDYYFSQLSKEITLLSTDIGLICKTNGSRGITITATDLNTAEPMADVQIQVYDYVQQLIAQGKTDDKGICSFRELSAQPYLIIARKGKWQSYLTLNSNTSLSLSQFDIGGEQVKDGLKGFIYTERGVWRPGDSIFVGFILEHPDRSVLSKFPVIFELYNPRGMLVDKRIIKENVNGMYVFPTHVDASALTGNYRLLVRAGGSVFQKILKIETIKPNRLHIEVTPQAKPLSLNQKQHITITSRWLHGAPSSRMRVQCDATIEKHKTTFQKYPDYIFDDQIIEFSKRELKLFEGTLDETGKLSFSPSLQIPNAPGMLTAQIETRVYEPGGQFSIDISRILLSPYTSYAGLKTPEKPQHSNMYPTGKQHTFQIANVTEKGSPVNENQIELKIYKLLYSWWWETYSNFQEFLSNTRSHLVENKLLNVHSGTAQFNFTVQPENAGVYVFELTDKTSGHKSRVLLEFGKIASEQKQGAELLHVAADKSVYSVGDQVTITCIAPQDARAYISIEKNNHIVSTAIVKEKNGMIEYTMPIIEQYAPNIYVWITLLQPYKNHKNGLPLRMYGVMPLMITNEKTILKPHIQTASHWQPESQATLTIKESSGKPMSYTIAIVDEGLLQLTKFRTPNPHDYFYAREALKVMTFDYFNKIFISKPSAHARTFSIGGGEEVDFSPGALKAQRFKPMVRFYGPFELKKSEIRTHQISIPDYVGAVRIMIIAAQDGAYGAAEKTIEVKSPLMVVGTAPRAVGPKEFFELPLAVFVNDKNIKQVQIQVKTNNLLKIQGNGQLNMKIPSTGEHYISVPVQVLEKPGVAKIEVIARAGQQHARWCLELDVRPSNPPITDHRTFVLEPGQTFTDTITPLGIIGTNENILEIHTTLPLHITGWLTYLLDYPHYCTEQLISGAFPLLYSEHLASTNQQIRQREKDKITAALQFITQRQLSNGAIILWPGNIHADQWVTSYAGHFAIEAQKAGYAVSKHMLQRWYQYQQNAARQWRWNKFTFNNDLMQAYRLYTLALYGSPDISLMNQLADQPLLSPQSRWLLAAAYAVAGKTEMAKKLIARLNTRIPVYREYSFTYGSNTRDLAFALETYVRLNMKNEAYTVLLEILKNMQEQWLSTQTAGQCLRSIALYLKHYPSNKKIQYELTINNKSQHFSDVSSSRSITLDPNKPTTIRLTNTGQNTIYITISRRGIPLEMQQIPAHNNLQMSTQYFDMDGQPLNIKKLTQGKTFYAQITISHPGLLNSYKNLALTQVFPSGWEIISDRFSISNEDSKSTYDYQDIRDDRILTYFDLASKQSKTFRVKLSATYAGKFYLPVTVCEAMYDGNIRAYLPGEWVEVVRETSQHLAQNIDINE